MKIKSLFVAVALIIGGSTATAQGLGDLLKGLGGSGSGSDLGSTLSNVVSGIFSKSDLTLQDIAGEYQSSGPAITFKSDNFLQKAGGIAGASALETKLQPYYEKYGLIGMPLSIDNDGNFTLTVKGIKLSGTVEPKAEQGEFTFNVMVAGKMKIGQFTSYIQKSGQNIDLMFDATKLKELLSTVGKLSGMKIASTMTSLLDSYDGANIGFAMQYTGAAPASAGSDSSAGSASGLGNIIGNVLGGSGSGAATQTDTVPSDNGNASGVGNLLNILNNSRKK